MIARRLLALLPQRWHAITGEMAKFGTIGVVNLIVNFTVFNALVLTVFRDGQLKANVIATVVATTGAYFMNRHWTYRHRPRSAMRREYLLFFLFNLIGLGIELCVLGLAKYGLHITHLVGLNAAKAVGVALGTIFRFWAYRTHVFKAGVVNADGVTPAVQRIPRPGPRVHVSGPLGASTGPDHTDEIFPAASSTRIAAPRAAVTGSPRTGARPALAARGSRAS
jgi:putative flippase GtrA